MRKPNNKYTVLLILSGLLIALAYAFMSDYALTLLFKSKVWPHKVNSIRRLERAKKKFPGVELDVVFEKDKHNFDVNHPPDISTGLSLSTYFGTNTGTCTLNYWLDLKNLDYDNDSLALAVLDSLSTLYQIPKNNIIVESGSPQYMKGFLNKGFRTSYYLPAGMSEANEKDLDTMITRIKENIASYSPTYISFEYKNYRLMKEKFPAVKKITWFGVYGSVNKMTARLLLFDLLMDKQVEVLLIPFD